MSDKMSARTNNQQVLSDFSISHGFDRVRSRMLNCIMLADQGILASSKDVRLGQCEGGRKSDTPTKNINVTSQEEVGESD